MEKETTKSNFRLKKLLKFYSVLTFLEQTTSLSEAMRCDAMRSERDILLRGNKVTKCEMFLLIAMQHFLSCNKELKRHFYVLAKGKNLYVKIRFSCELCRTCVLSNANLCDCCNLNVDLVFTSRSISHRTALCKTTSELDSIDFLN